MQLDIYVDTSSNNNNLPSHEKSIIRKEKKYKNMGRVDLNPHVNKNDI